MTAAAALAPYVDSLVAYDVVGEPGVHIGLPSTSLTLVLTLDEPLDVGWEGDDGSRASLWGNVSGLHDRPAAIHHGARQRGVMVGLTVAGARALLGVRAGDLAGQLLEVGDVAPDLADLPERLAAAPAEQHVGVVARALMAALARREAPGPRAEVGRALAGLTRGERVQDVAAEVGFSRRHLGELVRAESGLSPKEFQRIARFERSHALVAGGLPLAEVAAAVGYADQSHLTREWTALAGCSPSEWRRRELPNVQDVGGSDTTG